MQLTTTTLLSMAAAAMAAPTTFSDGYPAPSPQQLKDIGRLAGGQLPNGALPTSLTATAIATLQLIALNEDFEVHYFDSLLKNLTSKAQGYTSVPYYDVDYAIETIKTIKNQEELHSLGANGILKSANAPTVASCEYAFPVCDFESAIALANTFTDVVIGVLPQAQTVFATDGNQETALVNLLGSIISQESEQNGWFRTVQHKIAPAAPFLTTEGPQFAFSFLKGVIKPGCAAVDTITKAVPPFDPLTVETKHFSTSQQIVTFSVASGSISSNSNQIVYISGQNVPLSEPITNVRSQNGKTLFDASLPFDTAGFARGLTIAAVTKTANKNYASIADVAADTAFGPGIIEIN